MEKIVRLVIMNMQIKTVLKSHLTLVRVTIIKKETNAGENVGQRAC